MRRLWLAHRLQTLSYLVTLGPEQCDPLRLPGCSPGRRLRPQVSQSYLRPGVLPTGADLPGAAETFGLDWHLARGSQHKYIIAASVTKAEGIY